MWTAPDEVPAEAAAAARVRASFSIEEESSSSAEDALVFSDRRAVEVLMLRVRAVRLLLVEEEAALRLVRSSDVMLVDLIVKGCECVLA